MNYRIWLIQGIGLLLLAILMVFVIPQHLQRIPAAISEAVKQQLAEHEVGWVGVEVQGRDITLTGTAPAPADYDKVVQIVESVPAVGQIHNKMGHRLVDPYILRLDWVEEQLSLEGFLPDEAVQQQINQQLERDYDAQVSANTLKLAHGNPPQWAELVQTLLEKIQGLELAHVEMVGQQIHLSGKTDTVARRKELKQSLASFEEEGYEFELHIIAADEAARICQQKFDILLRTPIAFESGKALISESSYALLDDLARTAMLCPNNHLTISGHTDDRGDAESNLKLSDQRARAVASHLFQEGIDTSRITTLGQGSKQPIADNETEEGRAKNRRIEFVVEGK